MTLLLEILMGQNFWTCPIFSAAAVTRAQANQEKVYRKLSVPEQIISKDKEAFKQAQDSDPKLNGIRQRVKSGSVTVSRGLNRGETKFVLKKDLMYRQFTKGIKLTLQLVIPESFHEKVLRLAHETLMSGHLGIKDVRWCQFSTSAQRKLLTAYRTLFHFAAQSVATWEVAFSYPNGLNR